MTPYQLLKKLYCKPIIYGWYDYVNNKNITPKDSEFEVDGYFDKHCRVLKPLEVYTRGIGTCWDLTLLEYFELNRMGLNPRAFYIEGNNATHSAVYYQDQGMIFWFEYSWHTYIGIHGPYKDEETMFKYILQDHIAKDSNYKVVKMLNKSFDVKALIDYKDAIKCNDFLTIARRQS